ncbi:unnamed protein product [Bathycoccus prasinos]
MKAAAKNNHHHCDRRLLFLSDAFHRRNHQSCLPRAEEEKKKISSSSFPFLTAFGAFDEEKNENKIGDERRNSLNPTEETDEEMKKEKMSSSTSSLWATEAEFAKDAKEMERLKMMLKRAVDEAAAKKKKKLKKKKKKGIDVDGKMAIATVKVIMLKGERLFSRHAMKSFEIIESRDGNIESAFGERRLRELYGRRVVKSDEKKKGTTMIEVHIDRVQGYSDADEESDVVVVGCVDASSTGLGVNFEDTPEFRNEVRLRVDANDVIEGVHHPFVFVQLDSLVSSFGSECRFECYDARNDFEPLDFEIV